MRLTRVITERCLALLMLTVCGVMTVLAASGRLPPEIARTSRGAPAFWLLGTFICIGVLIFHGWSGETETLLGRIRNRLLIGTLVAFAAALLAAPYVVAVVWGVYWATLVACVACCVMWVVMRDAMLLVGMAAFLNAVVMAAASAVKLVISLVL